MGLIWKSMIRRVENKREREKGNTETQERKGVRGTKCYTLDNKRFNKKSQLLPEYTVESIKN